MRVFKGTVPSELKETHARVTDPEFVGDLEAAGVPLVQYADDRPRHPWAARWAVALVSEWHALEEQWAPSSDDVLRRVVSWVQRSNELDFAEAALSVYRLSGDLEEVRKMLTERKDLV